jgi:predicted transcriptional regulator
MLSHVTAIRSSAEILDETPEMEEAQQRRFQEIISEESVRMSQTAQTLAGLLDQSGDVFQAATPADEVDDFMLQHNAWFPELERVGDEIRQKVGRFGGSDEVSLTAYLHRKHATTVVRLDSDDTISSDFRSLTKFDPETSQVSFLANAPRSTRRFQLGRQIALLEAEDAINGQLDDPLLTSDAARDRTRHALSSYVAGVLIFPYEEFHQLATGFRYDIEKLCQHYDASFEQVCHRLIALRNPNLEGVPFAFLRSDPAGFITKRFPLPGLPLLRNGHACPLWAIFNANQTPNRTIRRLVEFPNRARYLMIAQAVTKQPNSFHEAPFLQSTMLICDILHATNTVYADGSDLSSELSATPVGPSCRMCSRSDCRFRNESQIVEAGSP